MTYPTLGEALDHIDALTERVPVFLEQKRTMALIVMDDSARLTMSKFEFAPLLTGIMTALATGDESPHTVAPHLARAMASGEVSTSTSAFYFADPGKMLQMLFPVNGPDAMLAQPVQAACVRATLGDAATRGAG